jgi:hypothetical protein
MVTQNYARMSQEMEHADFIRLLDTGQIWSNGGWLGQSFYGILVFDNVPVCPIISLWHLLNLPSSKLTVRP